MPDDSISTFVSSSIRQTDFPFEFEKILGFYAHVTSLLAETEKKELDLELSIAQVRETFGEKLAATTESKVSEALIARKLVSDPAYLSQAGDLNTCKAVQRKLTGLKEALKMRHEACITLSNRASAELRIGS